MRRPCVVALTTALEGTFAVECQAHDGLHVFEDLFILEPVDHQNRPVPAGEYADKVLLTVLFNYTQPLIRYELTDSICMAATPCPCGYTFARIQGIRFERRTCWNFRRAQANALPCIR